jgi:hypothetical protein
MDRQLALQRGFQALEDEFARLPSQSVRRQRRTRNRPRVQGSWRDQGKGECWTKTGKGGGAFVVCEGSKGQKGVNNRNVRGDEDQKGRKKDKAIKNNRSVMKKYDVEGRVEDLDEEIYFTPLREEGGFVILGRGLNTAGTAKNPDGISENVDTVNTIRVPKDEFNAQYRVMRGFTNPDDKYNDLAPAEYELQGLGDEEEFKKKKQKKIKKTQKEIDKFQKEADEIDLDKIAEDLGYKTKEEKKLLIKTVPYKIPNDIVDKVMEDRENFIYPAQREKRRLEGLADYYKATINRRQRQIDNAREELRRKGTTAQEAIKLQREVRGERLRQEAQQERVDEFVREAQELGGGREGFRRRQRRRELGRQAIRKIRETQQDRLNREQRRRDLVESFEEKIKRLGVLRGRKERFDAPPSDPDEEAAISRFTIPGFAFAEELARLEREVGQELDRRERIRREV